MMESNKIACAVCSLESAEKTLESFSTSYDQIPVVIPAVEMYSCVNCGEKFFTPDQSKQVSKMVRTAVRDQLRLLPPERIIEIRRKHDLSQDRLETLLSLGPKVVTRWETGRVLQTKQADDLLRLIDRVPEVIKVLREIREETDRGRSSGRQRIDRHPRTADKTPHKIRVSNRRRVN
jgi:putative zinc finger/helix-turn-helix YgiT family protein